MLGAASDQDFELWPEHQVAWEVFLDCARQWRVVAVGQAGLWFQGLDASAVRLSLEARGIPRKRWHEVLIQLRTIEDEAVGILNEQT